MKVKSAIGGHWEITADGYGPMVWEATHSSYTPDGDSPYFHQAASAATLEELYVAIGELEADVVETRAEGVRTCGSSCPCQVDADAIDRELGLGQYADTDPTRRAAAEKLIRDFTAEREGN